MRLVLLGDVHLYRLWVPPWRLLCKRGLGQMNLWFYRRRQFDRSLLAPLLERVAALQPDLVLGSGDFTTTSLEAEFQDMAAALAPLAARTPVLLVPGNHDRYTFRAMRRRVMERYLGRFMPARFPHLQPLNGAWHLLALDAARPRPLFASGKLGPQQVAQAGALLRGVPRGHGLVVLGHYPLAVPAGTHDAPGHELHDAAALRDLLRAFPGPVLHLHGHIHQPWRLPLGSDGLAHVTAVNAGAPCRVSRAFPRGQGFWQIDLPQHPGAGAEIVHHVL